MSEVDKGKIEREARDRLVFTLPPTHEAAITAVDNIKGVARIFKIGPALIVNKGIVGPLRLLNSRQLHGLVDLSFVTDPDQLFEAVKTAAQQGAWGIILSGFMGPYGIANAMEATKSGHDFRPLVFAEPLPLHILYSEYRGMGLSGNSQVRDHQFDVMEKSLLEMCRKAGASGFRVTPSHVEVVRRESPDAPILTGLHDFRHNWGVGIGEVWKWGATYFEIGHAGFDTAEQLQLIKDQLIRCIEDDLLSESASKQNTSHQEVALL